MKDRAIVIVIVPAGAGIVAAGLGAFLLADVIGVIFSIVFWVCAAGTIVYGASLLAARITGKEAFAGVADVLEPVAEVFGMIVYGMLCILGAGLATIGLFLVGLWLIVRIS